MPVDTGFLRASLLASTSAMPSIDKGKVPAEGARPGQYVEDATQIELVINGAKLGDPLYFGFTAAYAAVMEYGTGSLPPYAFVRTAAQGWQAIVARKEREIMQRMGLV